MVYECDQCNAALPPGVTVCPKCGEKFENAVPLDASVPASGFSAKSLNQTTSTQSGTITKPKRRTPLTIGLAIAVLLIGLGFATYFAMAHADPHNLRITEDNKTKFTDSIKDSKGLTVDENRMLIAYMMRYSINTSLGHNEALNPVGKTVGDIIKDESKFEAQQKQEEADQARLTAETQAKEEALHAQLRGDILLTVGSKDFMAADYQSGRLEDAINFTCAYQNNSKKNIRAFTGTIRFNDLFGKKIEDVHMTITDPVKAGDTGYWSGSTHFNQFIDENVQLKNTSLSDMKVEWMPSSIIYSDGSTVGDSSSADGSN